MATREASRNLSALENTNATENVGGGWCNGNGTAIFFHFLDRTEAPSHECLILTILFSILATKTVLLAGWTKYRSRDGARHNAIMRRVPMTPMAPRTLQRLTLTTWGVTLLVWSILSVAAIARPTAFWSPVIWLWYSVVGMMWFLQAHRVKTLRNAKTSRSRREDAERMPLLGGANGDASDGLQWRFMFEILFTPAVDMVVQIMLLAILWVPGVSGLLDDHPADGGWLITLFVFIGTSIQALLSAAQVAFLVITQPMASNGSHDDSRTMYQAVIGWPAAFVKRARSLAKRSKTIWVYMWPAGRLSMQLLVVSTFLVLLLARLVNVLAPLQTKKIVDILSEYANKTHGAPSCVGPLATDAEEEIRGNVWWEVGVFVLLRFLQGGMGLLANVRAFLWTPLRIETTRRLTLQVFQHLHDLPLSFHVTRKTGEVLRVMDRGTNSMVNLFQAVTFNILPVIADIIIAIIVFAAHFDAIMGFVVFMTMVLYVLITIGVTQWRTKFRREMIDLDNKSSQIAVDSLLNFEAVKYYSNESFEAGRLDAAKAQQNKAEWKAMASLNVLNTLQNITITFIGLLIGTVITAKRIMEGSLTTGDFVFFMTYLAQLYGPLNILGTLYRSIQQNLIDLEQMLDLLQTESTVQDDPDAPDLNVTDGVVEFKDVTFSYGPNQPATLKNISFKVPKGNTVALVGSSGAGKSTVIKLLFRFYDVKSGRILIDGQDIRKVSQRTLRKHIGVVPQDTVLFNDTVEYNIAYAKPEASFESIQEAARMATIHDRILEFPDQYETRVGERGLRLSGGEKQRIAIARNFLKDPKIMLLDEATSALDSNTEKEIQSVLNSVIKQRTSIVIAHRLSTIQHADQILVFERGEIKERGTHQELLSKGGLYEELWRRQVDDDSIVDPQSNSSSEIGQLVNGIRRRPQS